MSSNIGKPRKKKLIGVASAAGQGAMTGGGFGWGAGMLATTDQSWKRQKIGFAAGSALGAGIAGYNKYKQLSKPKKIKVGKIK